MIGQLIGRRLHEAGLIQFGAFPRHGVEQPLDLMLSLLGSYPSLLRDLADAAAAGGTERFAGASRLLAAPDAVPLGVALALRLNVPLVYSKGRGASPVDDLVGAYDIGHAAVLVTHSLGFDPMPDALIQGARRVGLDVRTVITVLACRPVAIEGVEVIPLVRLTDLVDDLTYAGVLPAGQAARVREWLGSQ